MTDILSTHQFAGLLDYASVEMDIQYFQADSGKTGAGEDIVKDQADPQWYAEITLDQRAKHADALGYQALVALLNGAIGRFYMYDPRLPYPIRDPDGSLLGAANPKILDINGNRDQIKVKNLPGNYPLTLGDRWHSEFGTDPVHRTYHYFCDSLRADGDGNTDWIPVRPNVPDGVSNSDAITLIKPSPVWRMVSGSKKAGAGQGQITPGPSWRAEQVF